MKIKKSKKDEIVLSISLTHDSGAAIFIRGKLIAAIAEERINRIKFTRKFPEESIKKVCELSGIGTNEISKVIVASTISPNWISLMIPDIHEVEGSNVFSPLLPCVLLEQVIARKTGLINIEGNLIKAEINKRLKGIFINATIEMNDHHYSHCYSAYSNAPFDNSLIVSIDAFGDGISSYAAIGNNGHIKIIQEMSGFQSPGIIYAQITQLLGFRPGRHEGKITGLAAYGDYWKCEGLFRELLDIKNNEFKIKFTTNKKHRIFREIMKYDKEDIAAGLQHVFEDIIVRYIRNLIQITGRHNVALAGGVFANVKLNQKIHEIGDLESIFIYPNMSDGGLSVGAGCAYFKKSPQKIESIYLGDNFDDEEIEMALKENKFKYAFEKEIEKSIAVLLAEGKVVARYNGRMEYGPRALGNRSILYKTTDVTVNDWLNKKLKRTEFMPFAPSTLSEYASEYYMGMKGAEIAAKYMTITFNCTERSSVDQPACVHVDNTARPQIVDKEDNPIYYKIISEYFKLTGIPSILNTSFNVHEEPIVHTPRDAIKSFLECGLDVLAIGNYIVKKDNM